MYVIPFEIVPQFLDALFCFFPPLFILFALAFEEVLLTYFQAH